MGRFQKRLITVAALCLVVTGKVCAQTLHYDKPAVFFEEALVIGMILRFGQANPAT